MAKFKVCMVSSCTRKQSRHNNSMHWIS